MKLLDALIQNTSSRKINHFAIYPHTVFVETSVNTGYATPLGANYCISVKDVGSLHHKTTDELAPRVRSPLPLEAAIGLAAINSSLDVAAFKDKFTKENAAKIMIEKGSGKNAAVIGHFPFVNRFRQKNIFKNLWVFELAPKDRQDLSPEMFSKYLPKTDVLMITATSIINKTFSKIMCYLPDDSFNIMLGPTTPLNPLLFDFNIDVLSGAVPVDNKLARTWFSQGSKYRETKGIKFVSLRKDRIVL